jgi:hypothetical protein
VAIASSAPRRSWRFLVTYGFDIEQEAVAQGIGNRRTGPQQSTVSQAGLQHESH